MGGRGFWVGHFAALVVLRVHRWCLILRCRALLVFVITPALTALLPRLTGGGFRGPIHRRQIRVQAVSHVLLLLSRSRALLPAWSLRSAGRKPDSCRSSPGPSGHRLFPAGSPARPKPRTKGCSHCLGWTKTAIPLAFAQLPQGGGWRRSCLNWFLRYCYPNLS